MRVTTVLDDRIGVAIHNADVRRWRDWLRRSMTDRRPYNSEQQGDRAHQPGTVTLEHHASPAGEWESAESQRSIVFSGTSTERLLSVACICSSASANESAPVIAS